LNKLSRIVSLIVVSFMVTILTVGFTAPKQKKVDSITYNSVCSQFMDFSIKNNYIIYEDYIFLKNNTNKSLTFHLQANLSSEKKYLAKNTTTGYACKKDSLSKEKFSIKAKEEKLFHVWFKAKSNGLKGKTDRLPPKNITIVLVK
jgi:hypothetical protein